MLMRRRMKHDFGAVFGKHRVHSLAIPHRGDHQEFVAAVAHHEIAVVARRLNRFCRAADGLVADLVAVLVVDDLQVVHVHEQHPGAALAGEEAVEDLLAVALVAEAVVEAGEGVVDVQAVQGLVQLAQQAPLALMLSRAT